MALNENYEEIVKYQKKYFKKQAEECWEREGGYTESVCEMYEKKAEMNEDSK